MKPAVERVEERILLATFTVTNTSDSTAAGSLRWAIGQSNATTGPNIINFDIATSGVETIAITSALPAVTVPVTINGTTEPGYKSTPLIELDGAGAGTKVDGLDIEAGDTTVKGLAINRFTGEGINLSIAGSDTIQDDFLGTNPAGTVAEGNGLDGILVQQNSNSNTILDNLISGNSSSGINLDGDTLGGTNPATSGNLIAGNLLGTDVTGKLTLANFEDGVSVYSAPMTTIGGTTAATRNIISGNGTGMELYAYSDGSVIEGNYVGTDITGSVALGNNGPNGFFNDNIVLRGMSNSTIGGTAVGAGNVISGGSHYGIDTFVIGSDNIVIQGNLIGTNATGTQALGNASGGIVMGGVTNVTIGGTAAGAGNVISANGGTGIQGSSNGLIIQGNDIGTDISGTLPLGNRGDGIEVSANGTIVGGTVAGAANIIANSGGTNYSNVVVDGQDIPILSNSIYNSGYLGIQLNGSANNSQAAPVLTSAVSMNTFSTIVGTLSSAAGTYTVQFFSTPSLDQKGNVEGETLLGTATVTIQGTSANFSIVVPSGFTPGSYISATATDSNGNTSEFSAPISGTGQGNGVGDPTIVGNGSPTNVLAGQNVTDSFTISNTDQVADNGVVFSDSIPAGTSFVSGLTSTGLPVVVSNGVATVNIGELAPGLSVMVTIVLTALPASTPSFTNIGSVTSTTPSVLSGTDTASITTTVNASADLSVGIQGPTGSTMVGQELTYIVTVINSGPSPATGVTLTDYLPTAVTFVSASPSSGPSATESNGLVTEDFGNLGSGESVSLAIIVTAETGTIPTAVDSASVIGNQPDPNYSNNTASFSSVVTPIVADLSVAVAAPSSSTPVGDDLTYVVTVTNNGPSTATGAILTNTLPTGVTLVSATPSTGPSPVLANGVLTDDFGSLADGASATLTIVVLADPGAFPIATDSASVVSDDFDSDLNNNSASAAADITQVADVSVAVIASASSTGVGQPLTYTVTVTNNGPSPASDVILTDTLPANVKFGSASSGSGPTPTQSSGTVTADIGALAAGASTVVKITIMPTALTAPLILDIASVAASETDPNTTNNSANVVTGVVPAADLAIVNETASPSTVSLGQPVTLTINVVDNGPSYASGVVVTDTLPAGLTFVSGTAAGGGTVTATGGVVSANLGIMLSGGTSVVTILATTTAVGTMTDKSSVTSTETDPIPSNNTGGTTITVTPSSDLSVLLGGPASPFFAGDLLTYTAIVTNSGPSPATNVVFTDPLVGGDTFQSVEANQVDGTVVNGVVTQPLGTLAAGASMTVVLTVIPTQTGTVTDTATVTSAVTDPNLSNNSSSVTTTLIAPYRTIEFSSPIYLANQNAGFVPITLERLGDLEGAVTVHFSTAGGGNGTPGVDYEPVSVTVDFAPEASQEVVDVPVLPDPYGNQNELVTLQLDTPTGGALLAQGSTVGSGPVTAILDVINPTPVLVGPIVTDVKLTGPVSSITSIEVDTTGNLNPLTATFAPNYTITAMGGTGKSALPFGTMVPVVLATYNATTGAVTLTPAVPLPANELFLIDINGTRFGALSDRAGNLLNSVVGVSPGSDYLLTVARGTNITYTDGNNNAVNLKLSGPGTIDLDRSINGQFERVQVVGGVVKKTIITGSVHPNGRRTTINSILGLSQFGSYQVKLTTPPFYLTNLVYPNDKTLIDAPAVDTLIPSAPTTPSKKVAAKSIVSTSQPHDAVTAQAILVPNMTSLDAEATIDSLNPASSKKTSNSKHPHVTD